MNRTMKFVIAGATIAVIGLIIMLVALGLNGWRSDEQFNTQITEFNDEITGLKFDLDDCELNVNFYDGQTIKADYEFNDRVAVKFDLLNSNLKIEQKSQAYIWGIGKNWRRRAKMNVSIPNDNKLNIDFKLNAGIINVASGKYGDITGTINAGKINFENIESENYNMKINAGNVKVQNLTTPNLDVQINAGTVQLAKLVCDKFLLKVNAGDILANDVVCKTCDVTVNAGDCEIERISLNVLNLDINTGKTEITIVGKKSEYNIDVTRTKGGCNVGSQSGTNANKRINIDVDMGDVDIDFVQ